MFWISFVAHLKKMLRAKARERSAKGRRKGCFWEKVYWTTPIWEFPKIRGTLLGVPITRIAVYWGLYWDPFISGNYHTYIYIYVK